MKFYCPDCQAEYWTHRTRNHATLREDTREIDGINLSYRCRKCGGYNLTLRRSNHMWLRVDLKFCFTNYGMVIWRN